MMLKIVGLVGLGAALAVGMVGPTAAKKAHHRSHARVAPYAVPGSISYGYAGPHMIEVRPGLWISSWDCVTDEGQGRFKPCSSGPWR